MAGLCVAPVMLCFFPNDGGGGNHAQLMQVRLCVPVFFCVDVGSVVVLSGAAPAQRRRISKLCRLFGAAFYTVETFGYDG